VGAARQRQAGESSRPDDCRPAGSVAKLGPTGRLAGEARSFLTRVGRAGVAACLSIADVGFAFAAGRSRRSRRATTDLGIASGSLNARANVGLPGAGVPSCWAGAVMGRATAIGVAAGRRASQARSAVMEPARSGMGGAKACRLGTRPTRRASFGRLGSIPARGRCATAHGRAIVGGASRRCSAQVGVAVVE
jgi:hypothetical protein